MPHYFEIWKDNFKAMARNIGINATVFSWLNNNDTIENPTLTLTGERTGKIGQFVFANHNDVVELKGEVVRLDAKIDDNRVYLEWLINNQVVRLEGLISDNFMYLEGRLNDEVVRLEGVIDDNKVNLEGQINDQHVELMGTITDNGIRLEGQIDGEVYKLNARIDEITHKIIEMHPNTQYMIWTGNNPHQIGNMPFEKITLSNGADVYMRFEYNYVTKYLSYAVYPYEADFFDENKNTTAHIMVCKSRQYIHGTDESITDHYITSEPSGSSATEFTLDEQYFDLKIRINFWIMYDNGDKPLFLDEYEMRAFPFDSEDNGGYQGYLCLSLKKLS